MIVQSLAYLQAALTAVKSAILAPMAGNFKIKLAQVPFSPAANSVPGTDFTEATYDGYSAATVAGLTANTISGNGYETTSTGVVTFSPTGTTTPNQIGGYWMEDHAGNYLGGEAFGAPVQLNGPLTSVSIVPRWLILPTSWPNTVLP